MIYKEYGMMKQICGKAAFLTLKNVRDSLLNHHLEVCQARLGQEN